MEKIGTGPEVVSREASFLVYKKQLQEVQGSNEDRRQQIDIIGFFFTPNAGERERQAFSLGMHLGSVGLERGTEEDMGG